MTVEQPPSLQPVALTSLELIGWSTWESIHDPNWSGSDIRNSCPQVRCYEAMHLDGNLQVLARKARPERVILEA